MRLSQRHSVPATKLRTTIDIQIDATEFPGLTDGTGHGHLHPCEPKGPAFATGDSAKLTPGATRKLSNRFVLLFEYRYFRRPMRRQVAVISANFR